MERNQVVATPQTVTKKQPKTFKQKIDAIKNDPTLSQEEKIMKAGKVMQDDYNRDYLKPLQDEYKRATAEYEERFGNRLKELSEKMNATQANYNIPFGERMTEMDKLSDAMRAIQKERGYSEAWDAHIKAAKMLDERNYEAHAKALADKISQVRPVGGLDMKGHLNNSRSPMRGHVEYAYGHYPTDWCAKSIMRGNLTPKKVNRGYYSDWAGEIAISGWDNASRRGTAFHELGHRFEQAVPEIRKQEKAFYERRTQGESLEWLGTGYAKTEKTRKDDFVHPYMGKDYGGSAYELVSMGFQYAFTEPNQLAKDPDMQQWIFGMLLTL